MGRTDLQGRFRSRRAATSLIFAITLVVAGCREAGEGVGGAREIERPALPEGAEAVSFLGEALYSPTPTPESLARHEALLIEAVRKLEADLDDAEALIWAGRRTAYLGDYREAIEWFTRGVERHPEDPRFYRHRGHRYITVRELDRAIADLERAAELIAGRADEIEPDGLPNALGIPLSTLHFNVWYHLGLARYLAGDLAGALEAYRACLAVSGNPDLLVATTHWMYMTLRRLGRDQEAARLLEPISAEMEIIENASYHRLLLLYRGELTPEDLLGESPEEATLEGTTAAYGVGSWYDYNGREEEAVQVYRRILAARDHWAAFGYIAAEAAMASRRR